jgi:hypothetical protein
VTVSDGFMLYVDASVDRFERGVNCGRFLAVETSGERPKMGRAGPGSPWIKSYLDQVVRGTESTSPPWGVRELGRCAVSCLTSDAGLASLG